MKRSEMIAKMLPNFLRAANNISVDEIVVLVSDCLAIMEGAGMLPPAYKYEADVPFRTSGLFWYDVNEWEPEDNSEELPEWKIKGDINPEFKKTLRDFGIKE